MPTPKIPKIILTFKKDEDYLYSEISKHSGKANWIKDILKQHVPGDKKSNKEAN